MTLLAYAAAAVAAAAATTVADAVLVPRLSERLGLVGVDVHKPWRPRVPEEGGVALLAGALASLVVAATLDARVAVALALTALWLFAVGFYDDRFRLDAISKPLLCFAAALPMLVLHVYPVELAIPFYGVARVSLVYPLLLAAAVMVSSNMFNMIDVMNGLMPSAALLTATALAGAAAYKALVGYKLDPAAVAALIGLAAALAAHLRWNLYPARTFNGDSGSLLVGGLLVAVACLLGVEAVFVVATLPAILNGFEVIVSAGGLKERREMERPVTVDDCGRIRASHSRRAPVTLVRLLTLREPLSEPEVVAAATLLFAISALLALAVAPLTYKPAP